MTTTLVLGFVSLMLLCTLALLWSRWPAWLKGFLVAGVSVFHFLAYDALQSPDPLDPGCHALAVQPTHKDLALGTEGLRIGLLGVKSLYLEELLSLLMTVGTQTGTAGPVTMVISLLLQGSEEQAVKMEDDSRM